MPPRFTRTILEMAGEFLVSGLRVGQNRPKQGLKCTFSSILDFSILLECPPHCANIVQMLSLPVSMIKGQFGLQFCITLFWLGFSLGVFLDNWGSKVGGSAQYMHSCYSLVLEEPNIFSQASSSVMGISHFPMLQYLLLENPLFFWISFQTLLHESLEAN